jgi:ABC-type lipoprotein release transport system permease subunit
VSTLSLILKELAHRKANAALSLLAVIVAVAFAVMFFAASDGAQRESAGIMADMNSSADKISKIAQKKTKRIQRDMGQNLRIVSKDTDLAHFWDEGFSQETFSENWVKSFTNITETINYSHLSAVLKWKVRWRDTSAMIYGLAPREVAPPGRKKPVMITPVKRGTVQLGRTLADIHGVKRDATVNVEGGEFKVARVLSEKGSGAEIRIYMHLADAQAVLKREGQINEIQALDCYCADETQDTLTLLRKQLAPILPEAKVFRMQDMAEAREQQRRLMEAQLGHEMPKVLDAATGKQGRNLAGVFGKLLPLVILVCGVLIAALAMLNTRARSKEIGVLRALGQGGERIALLFLGRAIVIGVLGALVGFAIGNGLAIQFGRELFELTADQLTWENQSLGWALLLAPAFAALASFIPAMLAVTQDPAETLRHDS